MEDRPSIDPLSHALGALESKIDSVLKTQSEDRDAAAKSRTHVRGELHEISEKVDTALAAGKAANTKIADFEPRLRALEDRALLSKGAMNLAFILARFGQVLWAGIGAVAALFLDRWMHK